MGEQQRFYLCEHCGNLVGMIKNSGVPMMCCGQKMTQLIPNTSDGAGEKHLPVCSVDGLGVKVQIGSVIHPSTEEHHIEWIYIETLSGGQRKIVKVGDAPTGEFALVNGDKALSAFAYCNLHGLWQAKL